MEPRWDCRRWHSADYWPGSMRAHTTVSPELAHVPTNHDRDGGPAGQPRRCLGVGSRFSEPRGSSKWLSTQMAAAPNVAENAIVRITARRFVKPHRLSC